MTEITKETLFSSNTQAENEQLSILKRHFPNCFDKQGAFLPEKMAKALQSNGIKTEKESYSLNWLGKSYAKILKDRQPETLLAEDIEHNQKPENQNSENILIQGDNLEVLKHLKHAYKNQIKMIYIDPPYNTASDGFVYQDDRKFTPQQLVELGMDLEEAERVLEFTAKKSNSHSAWLTFMYPRLYIARELLRDDGVIFISIDDNEQAQLKLLCDEVFGEENFISNVVRRAKIGGGSDNKQFATEADYLLAYAKCKNEVATFYTPHTEKDLKRYSEQDELGKFFWDTYSRAGLASDDDEDDDSLYYSVIFPDSSTRSDRWRRSKDRLKTDLESGEAKFVETKNGWNIHFKQRLPEEGKRPRQILFDGYGNSLGTAELSELFKQKNIFKYPKYSEFIKFLSDISTGNNDLILDFFAGSGTTAHAIMKLNVEQQNKKRQFICVQIDDILNPKKKEHKAAYNTGYKTIFDITKARIEKSAVKIRQDFKETTADLGFKIFKTEPHFQTALNTDFDPQIDFLPKIDLNNEQLHQLLTTWRVFDGCRLTEKVETFDLAGYTAYCCRQHLYLLASGFTSESVKALIERLDHDKDFVPERIVLFGENIDSAMQKELAQAVKTYANKKGLNNLSVLARY
ncbi:putative methyltransferase [Haemophilus influenzae]|uniref:site-specific DNA-methyltransferase n=1 Tax=Haemophilus influenzae TaxID=727 RepID=UPI000D00F326|nr:site-specific DNA-methyltransferase [Haemophilus influenzae]MCK9005585.1 site-specific DNA-methyltransferase [Haemophilus influenzae]PRI65097.1 putative methyltransferase [Haemophilus influenzae]